MAGMYWENLAGLSPYTVCPHCKGRRDPIPEEPEPTDEPEDDDGLTGPEDDEEQDTRAREQNEAMREDTEDYRRELARFDAERRGR
jgi:hypothetical protein